MRSALVWVAALAVIAGGCAELRIFDPGAPLDHRGEAEIVEGGVRVTLAVAPGS